MKNDRFTMRNTPTDEKLTSTFEGGDRMTGAHTNRTHNVDALLQSHPELCGTRVGPSRTPTVHPCPQREAPWLAHNTLHARHRNEKIKVQHHAWITNSKKKHHFPSRLILHVFSRFANVSRREVRFLTAKHAPFCPTSYFKGSKSCV